MKSYCLLANDSIEFKGRHFSQFSGKTHYLGLGQSKLKAAHPVNCFHGFLGKTIKNCLPSKLSLFTSLTHHIVDAAWLHVGAKSYMYCMPLKKQAPTNGVPF